MTTPGFGRDITPWLILRTALYLAGIGFLSLDGQARAVFICISACLIVECAIMTARLNKESRSGRVASVMLAFVLIVGIAARCGHEAIARFYGVSVSHIPGESRHEWQMRAISLMPSSQQ